MKLNIQNLQKIIFYYLFFIFFIIPEPVQKPFKIILGFFFMIYAVSLLLIYKKKFISEFIIICIILISILFIIFNGGYQSSIINVMLCTFGVYSINKFDFNFKDNRLFKILFYGALLSMALQLMIFRTNDGRPTLSYEINLSGAYLFLFFILSNIINKKIGVLFVIIASFLLLSRLLIFSIIIYYLLNFLKKYIPKIIFKIHLNIYYFLILTLFYIFNFWFLSNINIETSYNTSATRVTQLNDGSNKLRFLININVLSGIFIERDPNLKFGYGQVSKGVNLSYSEKYKIMPHNEFLVSIVEFGYIFTILTSFFILRIYNSYFDRERIIIIAPLFLYTLILWVRFFIIPSFEMIFILFLLKIDKEKL